MELTNEGATDLIAVIEEFLHCLVSSQADTYTSPFEIVSKNLVLGMDVVSPSSLYGFERSKTDILNQGTERVVVPDTSDFLYPPLLVKLNNPKKIIMIFKKIPAGVINTKRRNQSISNVPKIQ